MLLYSSNLSGVMDAETISKNGASPKSQMSRGNICKKAYYVLLIVFSLTLTSCGGDDDDDGNSGLSISGTIEGDWDKVGLMFDDDETWTVTVPVSNGKFSITFPKPDASKLELHQGVRVAGASLFASKGSQSTYLLGEGTSSKGHFYVTGFTYVDNKLDYSDSDGDEVWDMKLKKGWNPIVVYKDDKGILTYKCDPIPSGMVWSAADGW